MDNIYLCQQARPGQASVGRSRSVKERQEDSMLHSQQASRGRSMEQTQQTGDERRTRDAARRRGRHGGRVEESLSHGALHRSPRRLRHRVSSAPPPVLARPPQNLDMPSIATSSPHCLAASYISIYTTSISICISSLFVRGEVRKPRVLFFPRLLLSTP